MTRARDDRVFLASAPPALAARALALVLLALFAVLAIAVIVVRVPDTVAAPFVVVAVDGASPVRALHGGTVTSVAVVDAQAVESGAPLFTIRSESVGDRTAERETLATTLAGGDVRLMNERGKFQNQRSADAQEGARLAMRIAALQSRAVIVARQRDLTREIAARQQQSHDEGLTSWVELSQARVAAERLAAELEQIRGEIAEATAAAAGLRFQMASSRAAFDEVVRSAEEELDRARTRKDMLDGEGRREGNALTVVAPCTGTIVRLLVRSPGAVVGESAVLAEIACHDADLQAELLVPQRGFARVATGQPVKLRYDAFPYQRYGVRYATLRWIGPAAASPSTEDGVAFRALADLGDQAVLVNGRSGQVLPGMQGQASIIVGRRSLVSYVLEPLRQLRESMAAAPPEEGS